MTKKSVLFILLDSVFLAIFNLVFFVVGGVNHAASTWIAYGFIHFAYLMVVATPILTRKSSNAAIFGLALYSVSTAYFFAEFVVGLFFILFGGSSYKASLVIQAIIAAIYAVILLVNLIANEHTADNVEKHEAEVAYIKTTASELKALIGKASDEKANKAIEQAYDTVHSSPAKSAPEVQAIEKQIYNTISDLRSAVKKDDADQIIAIAKEITELTEERNRSLRLAN